MVLPLKRRKSRSPPGPHPHNSLPLPSRPADRLVEAAKLPDIQDLHRWRIVLLQQHLPLRAKFRLVNLALLTSAIRTLYCGGTESVSSRAASTSSRTSWEDRYEPLCVWCAIGCFAHRRAI